MCDLFAINCAALRNTIEIECFIVKIETKKKKNWKKEQKRKKKNRLILVTTLRAYAWIRYTITHAFSF